MGAFDDLIKPTPAIAPTTPAPTPGPVVPMSGGAFRDLTPSTPAVAAPPAADAVQGPAPAFSAAPPAPGAMTNEGTAGLTREQELRRDTLKRLVEQGGEPGYGTRFLSAAGMDLQKPLRGLTEAVLGEYDEWRGKPAGGVEKPATFGERYRAGHGAQADYADKARSAENTNPYLGAATDAAGSLATAIPTMAVSAPTMGLNAIRAAGPAAVNVGRYAINSLWPVAEAGVAGAIQGGANTAGTTLSDFMTGVGKGAGYGVAGAGMLGALMNRLGWVQSAQRAAGEATRGPTSDQLRQPADVIYEALKRAQAGFDAPQMGQLRTDIQQALSGKGYDPQGAHSGLAHIFDALTSRQATPWTSTAQGPTGSVGIKELYEQLGNATKDPKLAVIAGPMRRAIDQFLDTNPPAHNPSGVDIAGLWPQARDFFRRSKRTEDLEWKGEEATQAAAASKTQTEADKLRSMAGSTVKAATKPDTYSPYNDEQMAILQRMREGGGAVQRVMQSLGDKLTGPSDWAISRGMRAVSPVLPAGAGAMFGIGANKLGGEPVSTTMAALLGLGTLSGMRGIGNALKTGAGEYAQRDFDTLLRNISTGSSAMPRSVDLDRGTLARLAARAAAQRTGGAMAADIGTEPGRLDRTLDDAEQLRLGARKLIP